MSNHRILLAKTISRIVSNCNDSILDNLVQQISTGSIHPQSNISDWQNAVVPGNIPVPWIHDLINQWKILSESELLLELFYTAMETKKCLSANVPEVEIAWTGPNTASLGRVRSNYAILKDMIDRASREIYLVGYSLSINERIINIISSLENAKRRGCVVKIALHDNGQNHTEFLRNWKRKIPKPILLKWIGNSTDEMASLHAKMLIVDNHELFISSANLTYHGMGSNIELGARINGEAARKVARHFFSLEQAGEIVAYEGDDLE